MVGASMAVASRYLEKTGLVILPFFVSIFSISAKPVPMTTPPSI